MIPCGHAYDERNNRVSKSQFKIIMNTLLEQCNDAKKEGAASLSQVKMFIFDWVLKCVFIQWTDESDEDTHLSRDIHPFFLSIRIYFIRISRLIFTKF